jgi:branched-subunit amino acid aminotransferase/4-amino-4-deoxychorismate lyase
VTAEGAGWVWLEGRVLPEADATIPVTDRGFSYGDGLFETLRTRRRRVFRLDRHLDRLAKGAGAIGLTIPAGIEAAVEALLDAAGIEEGALRLIVTRGRGARGLRPGADSRPTLLLSLHPAPPFEVVAPLAFGTSDERVFSRSLLAGLKTLGSLPNITALLRTAGDDALLMDERQRVARGSSSNLFWVGPEGQLRTPSTACGIRAGVTREAVTEVAGSMGQNVREGEWPLAELADAREAFATSSLRGVAPIGSLDGAPIGDGRTGPVTRRLADGYRRLFDEEIA